MINPMKVKRLPKIKVARALLLKTAKAAIPLIAKAATIHPYTAVINRWVIFSFACCNEMLSNEVLFIPVIYKRMPDVSIKRVDRRGVNPYIRLNQVLGMFRFRLGSRGLSCRWRAVLLKSGKLYNCQQRQFRLRISCVTAEPTKCCFRAR